MNIDSTYWKIGVLGVCPLFGNIFIGNLKLKVRTNYGLGVFGGIKNQKFITRITELINSEILTQI